VKGALANDEMVATEIRLALAAGVPESEVERILMEEAQHLDGSVRGFELSASLAAARLENVTKSVRPGPQRPPTPRMDTGPVGDDDLI
jgi:hypothetical protein